MRIKISATVLYFSLIFALTRTDDYHVVHGSVVSVHQREIATSLCDGKREYLALKKKSAGLIPLDYGTELGMKATKKV